jgi:hypothetical protein
MAELFQFVWFFRAFYLILMNVERAVNRKGFSPIPIESRARTGYPELDVRRFSIVNGRRYTHLTDN